jgi:hypothetical protein
MLTTIDLSPSGYAGFDHEPKIRPIRLIVRQKRARADQRHIAHHDVEQLRQFIEPGVTEKLADQGGPFVRSDGRAGLIKPRPERAEFMNQERLSVATHAVLPIQQWRADVDQDQQGYDDEQRRENQQQQKGSTKSLNVK